MYRGLPLTKTFCMDDTPFFICIFSNGAVFIVGIPSLAIVSSVTSCAMDDAISDVIVNFPCGNLHLLTQLWSSYSCSVVEAFLCLTISSFLGFLAGLPTQNTLSFFASMQILQVIMPWLHTSHGNSLRDCRVPTVGVNVQRHNYKYILVEKHQRLLSNNRNSGTSQNRNAGHGKRQRY